jgi:hypothetical protein
MKKYPLLLLLLLSLALLVTSTQAFASPALDSGSPTETPTATPTNTPTEPPNAATQLANFNATRQAGKPHGNREHLKGTVSAVDTTSLTLTLGDASSVTIGLDPKTRMLSATPKGSRPGHIRLGDVALVQAIRTSSDSLVALFIMVMPSKPSRVHRVGTVTDYVAGVSITIQERNGAPVTFAINDGTKIMPSDRASLLAKGLQVTIIAQSDTAAAIGIVISPAIP